MLERVNRPSSFVTEPVVNALSFSVFSITFTKGKTVLAVLSFIVPETVTDLFCANEFETDNVMNAIMRVVILNFVISVIKKGSTANCGASFLLFNLSRLSRSFLLPLVFCLSFARQQKTTHQKFPHLSQPPLQNRFRSQHFQLCLLLLL